MLFIVQGAVEMGLLFAIMALGVYLSFRILDFPDLTVDGSFALGGAVAARLIIGGVSPVEATVAAFAAGGLAGAATGVLHTKGRITGLLAGILTMIALYSINLRVMGRANLPLLREETLVTMVKGGQVSAGLSPWLPLFFLALVLVLKFGLDWFLHTDLGLALQATGDNPRMVRSLGVNPDWTTFLGLVLSNALVGLSGALVAQYMAFADVNMGIGMIVIGLASVIIGEVIFGAPTVARATGAVIAGAIIYRLVIAAALRVGLEPTDLRLITAVLVVLALLGPKLARQWRENRLPEARPVEDGEVERGA